MKTEVLRVLKDSADFVSGQELSGRLGVSRTAVWKVIKGLKAEGYQIESVPNRGYCLMAGPDLLTESELQSRMKTAWAGRRVRFYEAVDSTNIRAKQLAEEGAVHGTLVVADQQTAGRGRRGRSWQSPPGSAIYMSLVLRPACLPDQASMLTLVMGLSVTRAVNDLTGLKAGIKWPNDVVINAKKVCGILSEMSLERDYIQYVVTGIGINVMAREFPEQFCEKATTLEQEAQAGRGRLPGRAELIEVCMKYFEQDYEQFITAGDMRELIAKYQGLLANMNQEVRVLAPGEEYCGVARGITKAGELIVESADGKMTYVYSGEVSVRGREGYV